MRALPARPYFAILRASEFDRRFEAVGPFGACGFEVCSPGLEGAKPARIATPERVLKD
jgi:hypothetical protein